MIQISPSTFTMKAATQAAVAADLLLTIMVAAADMVPSIMVAVAGLVLTTMGLAAPALALMASHTATKAVAMARSASRMARVAAVHTAMATAVAHTARAAARAASISENLMDESDARIRLWRLGWAGTNYTGRVLASRLVRIASGKAQSRNSVFFIF